MKTKHVTKYIIYTNFEAFLTNCGPGHLDAMKSKYNGVEYTTGQALAMLRKSS